MRERAGWAILVRALAYRTFTTVLRWANNIEGRPTETASGNHYSTRALREHVMQRLVERYGIRFPKSFAIFVHRSIQSAIAGEPSRATKIAERPPSRSVWRVEAYQGPVYVVYDQELDEVMTYLTEHMAHNPRKSIQASDSDLKNFKNHMENSRRS